jgi:para-nitrobenzyl esterase
MENQTPQSDAINRRSMLRRSATAGLALAAGSASAQEKPKTGVLQASKATRPTAPNLHPPVVQVKAGQLRGFRDGKTLTFLGVPYADAERFEMPKPVKVWEGIRGAQTWGPVCPIP